MVRHATQHCLVCTLIWVLLVCILTCTSIVDLLHVLVIEVLWHAHSHSAVEQERKFYAVKRDSRGPAR